jgi:hypothetical protein
MIGHASAAKRLRFNQTTAKREGMLTELSNIDPNPLTPTLSPAGRGRRAPEPMSTSEHISLAVDQPLRWLEPMQSHGGSELPRPEGERVGVRGLRR